SDLGGIAITFPGPPAILAVLNDAVWRADMERICLRSFRIGRPIRIRPAIRPPVRNQCCLLVVGHARHPRLHRLLTPDLATSAKRAGAGLNERSRLPDPSGRVEYEPLDLARILRGVCRHRDGTPRPADQIETWDAVSREDEINDRPDIPHRSIATHDWRV